MHTVEHLINQFIPENYHLTLTIAKDFSSFSGKAIIHGEALAEGKIKLHAKDLNVSSVRVNDADCSFVSDEANDILSIESSQLKLGKIELTIEYSAPITDKLHGIYTSSYTENGKTRTLVTTQFESHHAREAFPSVDEPAAKATFDVTLVTPSIDEAKTILGNMPIKSQHKADGFVSTTFETTPKMSTYLLAFIVGDLQRKTGQTKDGVEVNVYATPIQAPASLDFALEHSIKTIEFFNDYFETPYPLPKSDHVAIPDFSSGAMENWGLVTYRETALLVDPALTSISDKQSIATVISHELSHQWFGNLVTMKWWNNLWLNESFATLMEYVCVDALFPEWQMWQEFSANESVVALRRDAIDGVQPVQIDVHHPDEISTIFDGAIVYAKGARLLRMLQLYVGGLSFQTGLKEYFKKYAYSNTTGDDLWACLENASGKPVKHLMETWISQPGYPVVSLTKKDNTYRLEQKQFFVGPHEKSDRLWPIPLDGSSLDAPELLDQRTAEFTSEEPVIRLNIHNGTHFLTNYSPELLAQILNPETFSQLDITAKTQLLNEQTLLARAGVIDSSQLIKLLTAYKDETSEQVWGMLSLVLNDLKKFVEPDTDEDARLRQLAGYLASSLYQELGWQNRPEDSEDTKKLRSIIISFMLYSKDESALEQAKDMYLNQSLESLNSEFRDSILGAVVGNNLVPTALDDLLDIYKSTVSAGLKSDICSGICSTKNTTDINRLLDLLTDTNVIRTQDTLSWFVRLLGNRYGRSAAWQWLQKNWDWIENQFADDKSYDYFPRYAASLLMTRGELAEYINFFTPKTSAPALTRVINMGIKDLTGKIDLIERDKPRVSQALLDLNLS